METHTLDIAGIQTDLKWNNSAENLDALERYIVISADAGAQLIVLPEMFNTGFEDITLPETIDGPIVTWMQELATMQNITLCGSLRIQRDDRPRPTNTAIFVGPEGIIGMYDKARPFTWTNEQQHIMAGGEPCTVTVEGVRITPLISYDLRFPGLFWNQAHDTDLFIVLANWPSARIEHWHTLLAARAIENQAWVMGVSRLGIDSNRNRYSGDSTIIDPRGRVVSVLSEQQGYVSASIDADRIRRYRQHFPLDQDR